MPVIIDGTSGITTPSIDTTTPLITADGGTGTGTLTAGSVLVGNGTSAVTLVAAGSSGNVLTSNGTTWTSAAAGGGQLQVQLFTAPGTWTKPSSCTQVRVTVLGGGGGGNKDTRGTREGGSGGLAYAIVPVSAPVAVTVGAGGDGTPFNGNSGGTSSFGPAVTATGGAGGAFPGAPTTGSGTVAVGTAIKALPSISNVQNLAPYMTGIASGLRNGTPGTLGTPYSTTSTFDAGSGGAGFPSSNGAGGIGGVVVVEFVG